MLNFGDYNRHWSYYLAIEEQLANTARFVDFSDDNRDTYSVEFARIIMSAAAETDVVLKQLCKLLDNASKAETIGSYQNIINLHIGQMVQEVVYISQYNIESKPWEKFAQGSPPTWWTANNKVKHHRNTHFKDANLRNAIHAVGALHILIIYYYKVLFEHQSGGEVRFGQVTSALQPRAKLYSMDNGYYAGFRVVNSQY